MISTPPRVDAYGVLAMLEPMTSRQIGEFMLPFVRAALGHRASNTTLHVLRLCGWALSQREETLEKG